MEDQTMMTRLIAVLVLCAACVAASAGESPARRACAVWERQTGNTETPKQIRFSEDGATVEWCSLPGVAAAINAIVPTLATTDFPSPDIVVPLMGTNGVQVGTARIVVDRETMQAVAVVDSASPQKPWAEQRAAAVAEMTARAAHRANLAAIKTDLDQVEAALDQIDATTTGPMGVAIAATTGATKTALQEVRKVIADMKTATKNLKQASEKLRREVR